MGELSNFIKKKTRFREGDVIRYGGNIGETLSLHEEITTNVLIEKQDPLLTKDRERLIEERRHLKQDLVRSFSKRDSDQLLELETKISRILEKVRKQANLMELLLEEIYENERMGADIIAATGHRFQGSERNVMIFDSVDSAPQNRAGMLLTGKESARLINVAITRTKGKFLQVSNRHFIERNIYQGKTLRQLVDHQVRNNQIVTTKEIGTWIRNQHQNVKWIHARKLEAVFQDINSANSSIILSLPEGAPMSEVWTEQLLNRKKRVKLTVISKERWSKCDDWRDESVPFPFVLIDEQILWLGLPLEGAKEVQPPYVAVRLSSKKVCEYLLKQL